MIEIYTDGGCRGNNQSQNIGGYGAILRYGTHEKQIHGCAINTTNNKMELMAVIEALNLLEEGTLGIPVNVYSDSAYIVNCMNEGWYKNWMLNGWYTSTNKPVENKELWLKLLYLVGRLDNIRFYKIKGHINLSNSKELEKYYNKYKEQNSKSIPFVRFVEIVKMNIRVDELVNKSMDTLYTKA